MISVGYGSGNTPVTMGITSELLAIKISNVISDLRLFRIRVSSGLAQGLAKQWLFALDIMIENTSNSRRFNRL